MVELIAASGLGEAGKLVAALGELVERLAWHADFHVGIGATVPCEAQVCFALARDSVSARVARLEGDERRGFQLVGQGGWDVADFGACGLLVPAGQEGLVRLVRAFADFQSGAKFAGLAFAGGEAEQPIYRDAIADGDGGQRFRSGQASGCAGEQLREGGSVQPRAGGEGGLVKTGSFDQGTESLAKFAGEVSLVHKSAFGYNAQQMHRL